MIVVDAERALTRSLKEGDCQSHHNKCNYVHAVAREVLHCATHGVLKVPPELG